MVFCVKRKKRAPIKRVVIDKEAFNRISPRILRSPEELGFYMVGLVAKNIAYVLDFIEFPYSEKSSAHVSSDPSRAGRIFAICPAGLRILGTLHTHPGGLGTYYSKIDARTWLSWAQAGVFVHCITSIRGKDIVLAAYVVFNDKIVEIEHEFGDIKEKINMSLITIPLSFYFFYHKDQSDIEIRSALEKALSREIQKAFIPVFFETKSGGFSLTKRVFIYVKLNPDAPFVYEFAFSPEEIFGNVKSVILETLNLPLDTVFYIGDTSIPDNTPVKDLAGQIITTKSTVISELKRIVKEIVKEIVMDTVKTILSEELTNIKSSLRNFVREVIREELKEKENVRRSKTSST